MKTSNQYIGISMLLLLTLLSLQSCEEVTDWELKPLENDKLVVEAILTDELKIQEVNLTKSFDQLNGIPPKVNDANVWVEANGTIFPFQLDSQNSGLYQSEAPFKILQNLDYVLNIEWQGNLHQATSQLSTVAPLPEINFIPQDNPQLVKFDPGSFVYNPNQRAMFIMDFDWSHIIAEPPNQARIIFYSFDTVDIGGIIRPDQEEVIIPIGTIVHLQKFGLNEDFASYLRALVLETNWNGGAFPGSSSSLGTNLSGGALGFYSTCAVLSETFIAE